MSRPLNKLSLFQSNRPLDVILHWHKNGDLNLSPPYQRGDVWGPKRQRNFIRSILLGIPIPSIIISDRFGADWKNDMTFAVIYGKQRVTAVLKFFLGELSVPSGWFATKWLRTNEDAVSYRELSVVGQRCFSNHSMAFSEGKLPDLESEREVFELVNFGGVPQGELDE